MKLVVFLCGSDLGLKFSCVASVTETFAIQLQNRIDNEWVKFGDFDGICIVLSTSYAHVQKSARIAQI